MGKIFVIGDIHGTASKLDRLMAKLNINATEDTLVFVGDYIDRGPDPKRVIDTILELRKVIDNVICLRGNHEQMFLDYYLENKEEDLFISNGGITTLISYGFHGSSVKETMVIPESHMDFLMTLKPYYETDDFIFVHAGLRPGIPLERQNVSDLLWLRYDFINSRYDFGKTVVFGHTPLSYDMPFIKKNKICVDTGAVFGGKLTCVEMTSMKIHQV
jgi:serine/threonine protein phosphatase 1